MGKLEEASSLEARFGICLILSPASQINRIFALDAQDRVNIGLRGFFVSIQSYLIRYVGVFHVLSTALEIGRFGVSTSGLLLRSAALQLCRYCDLALGLSGTRLH